MRTEFRVVPTPINPLGMKGLGEAACVAAPTAIVSAVCDVLKPLDIHHIDMPLSAVAAESLAGDPGGSRQPRRPPMSPRPFDYARAETLEAVLQLLAENPETGKLLAGGHSLLSIMKLRLAAHELLIDIGRLPELQGIELGSEGIRIGRHHATRRSSGTIGGALAHADPSAD